MTRLLLLRDLRLCCVTILVGSSEKYQSIIRHGCGASGTESMSLLTHPATCDILNRELTNCPRTAFVLGEFATRWQQMMVSLLLDIAEPGQRNWEHAQDTDRCDGKSTATEGRRATLSAASSSQPRPLHRQIPAMHNLTREPCE